MLPAYFANMVPVFAQRLGLFKFLAKPIDGGRMIWGHPIFGGTKTWRGFVVGIAVAIVTAWLQYTLYSISFFQKISLINYAEKPWFLLGFLFGFGALFGDLTKSFFKRRFDLKPGTPWIPFDQLDFVIGSLIFVAPIYFPSWPAVIVILLISSILHILTNQIGYLLGIKNTRW
jgi:CDP-2,3-bis-(O-geranylgeranyl)-sn-glycerol synthase